jgi:two-component system sensor histidine kinase BaeS
MNRLRIGTLLGISHALVAVVLGVSISVFLSMRQEESLESELLTDLKTQAYLWSSVLDFEGLGPGEPPRAWGTLPEQTDEDLMVSFISTRLSIHQLHGELMNSQVAKDALTIGGLALEGQPATREIYYGTLRRDEYLYAAVPVWADDGQVLGAVCLVDPLGDFEEGIRRTRLGLFWLGMGLAVVSLVASLWLSTRLTRRIDDAQQLAARVADGDFALRLPEEGPQELAELARHLNRMAQELDAEHKARNTVIGNVTHELARPLGGLQLGIDSLKTGALKDPDLTEELLDSMSRSVQRVDDMVEDLALAARPSSQPVPLKIRRVAIEPFIRGLISRHWPAADSKGVRMRLDLESELAAIPADERRLSQIMGNLLDNALKYSPVGGEIVIGVHRQADEVVFTIMDDGPGIADKELEHIFEPFFQGREGKRTQAGLGLGLSIVKQLVSAHGGHILLGNRPDGGLQATVRLPIT